MTAFDSLLKKLPTLRALVDTYGDSSLFEYAKKHYIHQEVPPAHQQELLDFLNTYVTKRFGNDIAHKVTKSLKNNYVISTAEHQGPLGHPFFFQSSIIRGIVHDDTIVNFCTSHVSLGNSSYPRGIVFHGDGERAPQEYLHLPLFPARERMMPVFGHHAFRKEDIQKATLLLNTYQKDAFIHNETYNKIQTFLQDFFGRQDILDTPTYSQQITLSNYYVWHHLFPELPSYIALDSEDMLCDILLDHLDRETHIGQLLTSLEIQSSIEKHFNSLTCCFNIGQKTGTYLFWYQDNHGARQSLWRKGDTLVTVDGKISIKMNKEVLSPLLQHRVLIPSGLVVYTTLSCYYGLTCFGGFAQSGYLPKIQHAYSAIFGSREQYFSPAEILNEDFVFLLDKQKRIQTALDCFIAGVPKKQDLYQYCKNVSLKTSIEMMSDEIARCL